MKDDEVSHIKRIDSFGNNKNQAYKSKSINIGNILDIIISMNKRNRLFPVYFILILILNLSHNVTSNKIQLQKLSKFHYKSTNLVNKDSITLKFYIKNQLSLYSRLKKAEFNCDINNTNENCKNNNVFINQNICDLSSFIEKLKHAEKEKNESSIIEVNISMETRNNYNNEEEVENTADVISHLTNHSEKIKVFICEECFNTEEQLIYLEKRIKLLKEEFENIDAKTEFLNFVEKVNLMNMLKYDIGKVHEFLKVMKRYRCRNYEHLLKNYLDLDSFMTNLMSLIENKAQNNIVKMVLLN